MTHEDIRKLSKDSIFNQLLETSLAITARAVMLENSTDYQPSGLSKRYQLAVNITNSLSIQRDRFTIYIASDTPVNSLITIDEEGNFIYPEDMTTLDNTVNSSVSANYNILAGLDYAEMQPQ